MPASAAAAATVLQTDGPSSPPKPPSPQSKKRRPSFTQPVPWLPHREKVKAFYDTKLVQYTVASVILINFLAIIVEKEVDPYPEEIYKRHAATWQTIDDICNIFFFFELAVNLYGNFWYPFVVNPWNYLDTSVVIVGALTLMRIDLGPFSMLKVFRAFRVLRLFKRVKALNAILVALGRAIPGVTAAFIFMLIFMCIFAIIAVDLFRDFGSSGEYSTIQRYGAADALWGDGEGITYNESAGGEYTFFELTSYNNSAMTARGFHYGQEYYGTFFRSLYTLFQVRARAQRRRDARLMHSARLSTALHRTHNTHQLLCSLALSSRCSPASRGQRRSCGPSSSVTTAAAATLARAMRCSSAPSSRFISC